MFSTRLPASLVPTPLAAAVAARRRRPGRLLDLTLSNPTMAGLAYPETLATAFSNVAALQYDPDPRGLRSAREAIAAWHGSIGEPISADRARADGQHQRRRIRCCSSCSAIPAIACWCRARATPCSSTWRTWMPSPSIGTRSATPAAGSWTSRNCTPRSPRRRARSSSWPRTIRPATCPPLENGTSWPTCAVGTGWP